VVSYPVRTLRWWMISSLAELAELGPGYLGLAEASGQSLAVSSQRELTSRGRI
jgi:hypothetical protein